MNDIIRHFPIKRDKIEYKQKYDDNAYKKLFKYTQNIENTKDNYEKLKQGIDFTNHKSEIKYIKINSSQYKRLLSRFEICDILNKVTILPELYETIDKQHLNEIEQIKMSNKETEKYNEEVDFIIDKIKNLTQWKDYIEFDNKKYGLPPILKKSEFNYIHCFNDCFGNMEVLSHFYQICKNHKDCKDISTTCRIMCQKCSHYDLY